MFSWIFFYASALVLVSVLGLAVWHKLRDLEEFRRVLVAYELVPVGIAVRLPVVLAVVELGAVLEIVITLGASRYLALVLLVIYTGAMSINLLRGRRVLDCGCGGAPTPVSWWLIARNGCLIWFAWPQVPAGVILVGAGMVFAMLLVVFAAVLFALFYGTLNQLLANNLARDR